MTRYLNRAGTSNWVCLTRSKQILNRHKRRGSATTKRRCCRRQHPRAVATLIADLSWFRNARRQFGWETATELRGRLQPAHKRILQARHATARLRTRASQLGILTQNKRRSLCPYCSCLADHDPGNLRMICPSMPCSCSSDSGLQSVFLHAGMYCLTSRWSRFYPLQKASPKILWFHSVVHTTSILQPCARDLHTSLKMKIRKNRNAKYGIERRTTNKINLPNTPQKSKLAQ